MTPEPKIGPIISPESVNVFSFLLFNLFLTCKAKV